ncbi:MAG: hypothetical protein KTR32_00190 [Granulosicoccus sp.]|nr:hypothetical protein [Granulosicoccus sp.]
MDQFTDLTAPVARLNIQYFVVPGGYRRLVWVALLKVSGLTRLVIRTASRYFHKHGVQLLHRENNRFAGVTISYMKALRSALSFFLLVTSLLGLSTASGVEILIPSSDTESESLETSWTLRGEIEKGDFDKLISAIRRAGRIPSSIALDSEGGDVNEAINLGHFFRKALIGYRGVDGPDGKPMQSECSSACALIYFGAARKLTQDNSLTRIGLHRPYFVREYLVNLTPEQASSQYQLAENTIREYLQEMHVPDAVADVMFETEASSMSYFNDHELSEWIAEKSDYRLWLAANCIELQDKERQDLRLARTNPGIFTQDYTKALESKYSEFLGCRHRLIADTQTSVLRELGCSVVEDRTSC